MHPPWQIFFLFSRLVNCPITDHVATSEIAYHLPGGLALKLNQKEIRDVLSLRFANRVTTSNRMAVSSCSIVAAVSIIVSTDYQSSP